MKEVLKEPVFAEEIVNIVRSSRTLEEMREELRGYHANDIAQSLELMNRAERNLLYSALDAEWMADIISYIDNPSILKKSALTNWLRLSTKWMPTTCLISGRILTRV